MKVEWKMRPDLVRVRTLTLTLTLNLTLTLTRPMKVEWKMRPYLGVLPLVFSARKSAFSAPGSGQG